MLRTWWFCLAEILIITICIAFRVKLPCLDLVRLCWQCFPLELFFFIKPDEFLYRIIREEYKKYCEER
ncbi:unnamed protein product [Blepharisma stoltei]|uniref:Uncharacterized protein n=1 Tax=Blepharisma stoltei TaxID=1481888 RepID=A0AAU9K9R3_9CILI|nr:unnamed protein product [Blepharisma stoltei]